MVFDGEVITQLPVAARVARGMARTFQITEIFPELTVRENIRIGAESAAGLRLNFWRSKTEAARVEAAIDEMLTLTGLTPQADRLVGKCRTAINARRRSPRP